MSFAEIAGVVGTFVLGFFAFVGAWLVGRYGWEGASFVFSNKFGGSLLEYQLNEGERMDLIAERSKRSAEAEAAENVRAGSVVS